MMWIANSEDYAVNEPILLLCCNTKVASWDIRCYSFIKGDLKLLDGIS